MALMNVAILISIARGIYESKTFGTRAPLDKDKLVETFAPALRLSLIIIYLFTFFHKVNADFLNPEVSCAGVILSWVNRTYHVLPLDHWAVVASIWGTLLIELGVPLLLLFRRTVYVGLAIALCFHLFLSQYGGLYGFASMLLAVYFLFLPRSFTEKVAARFQKLLALVPLPSPSLFWFPAMALLLAVSAFAVKRITGFSLIYTGMVFWDIWLVGVVICFHSEFLGLLKTPADYKLRQKWGVLWIFPLITFLNGCAPYLGLKTETSWAMYSNLRTEIHPNHLIVPPAFKVFGFQDDLVDILETTDSRLQRYAVPEVALTYFEFRRICSSITEDFEVSYIRGGQEKRLTVASGASSDPELTRHHPWLLEKLLRFRPVDTGAHSTCRH